MCVVGLISPAAISLLSPQMTVGLFLSISSSPSHGVSRKTRIDRREKVTHKRTVLQVDSFAAVVCYDRQVALHAGHVEPLIEHVGELIVKALERQDSLSACFTTGHNAGSVDSKHRGLCHDTAFFVPVHGEVRCRRGSERKVPADTDMREF